MVVVRGGSDGSEAVQSVGVYVHTSLLTEEIQGEPEKCIRLTASGLDVHFRIQAANGGTGWGRGGSCSIGMIIASSPVEEIGEYLIEAS